MNRKSPKDKYLENKTKKINKIKGIAKKFKTERGFRKSCPKEFRSACYYNIYQEISKNFSDPVKRGKERKLTKEFITSKSFTGLDELRSFSVHAYNLVGRNNWFSEVFSHLKKEDVQMIRKKYNENVRRYGHASRRKY